MAVTLALVALCGLVTACGSSSKKSASSSKAATKVELEADNFYFKPTTISLKAGNDTIEVKNDSSSTKHNLTVEGLKVDHDLAPGSTSNVSVDAKPGTYKFHCEYHPTQMHGTITVT